MFKKAIFLSVLVVFCISSVSYAKTKKIQYNGQEINVNVKFKKTTAIVFPERVKKIIRGINMDNYWVENIGEGNVLYIMPNSEENAGAFVIGMSGEAYSFNFIQSDKNDSKVNISVLKELVESDDSFFKDFSKDPDRDLVKTIDLIEKKPAAETHKFTKVDYDRYLAEKHENIVNKEEFNRFMNDSAFVPTNKGKGDPDNKSVLNNDVEVVENTNKEDIGDEKNILEVVKTEVLVNVDDESENNVDIYEDLPDELNKIISLKGRNIPLNIYLNSVSRATGYNIILGRGVKSNENISISVDSIPCYRALKSILYPMSYGFKINKKDIVILASETRVFNISLPPISQSFNEVTSNESYSVADGASSDRGSSSKQVKAGTKITVQNEVKDLSFWKEMVVNLDRLITPSGSFSVNESAGMVVVTDLPGNLDRLSSFFEEVNAKLTRQLNFSLKIVEVTLTDEYEAGIDWTALAKNLKGLDSLSLATSFSSGGFVGGKLLSIAASGPNGNSGSASSGVSAVINLMEEMGTVEVLSEPSITVSNLRACVLQKGTSRSYVSESGTTSTNTASSTNIKTSQVYEGVTLRLLANIGKNDKQDSFLSISTSVSDISSIDEFSSGDIKVQNPTYSDKSINTTIKIEPGKSVMIGGLISTTKQNSHTGVPGLSRLPVIGRAFRHSVKKNNKKELVIIITPERVL